MGQERTDFYCYEHCRASDGIVAYVGKGCLKRAWHRSGRSERWRRTFAKHGLVVEIAAAELTEDEAHDMERALIAHHRLWGDEEKLINLTDGGEGTSGRRLSKETKHKLAKVQLGRKHTEEAKENMSKAQRGERHPNWGKPLPKATRDRIGAAQRGIKKSEEHAKKARAHLRNLAEARTGKALAPEHAAKARAHLRAVNEAQRGEKHPAYNPELLTFECIATGERLELTRVRACKQLGIRPAKISDLLAGRLKTSSGYRLYRPSDALE